MSRASFNVAVDDSFVDALAEALAAKLLDRLPAADDREQWLCGAAAAADYLGWPVQRIYKNVRRLPHRRDGNMLMFRRSELDAFLDGFYEGPLELDPARLDRSSCVPRLRNSA